MLCKFHDTFFCEYWSSIIQTSNSELRQHLIFLTMVTPMIIIVTMTMTVTIVVAVMIMSIKITTMTEKSIANVMMLITITVTTLDDSNWLLRRFYE